MTLKVIDLQELKLRDSRPGVKNTILFDENTSTQFLYSGIFTLKPGGELDLHYHDREEMQHVIRGYGILRDAENNEYRLGPGTSFYCPAGPNGAHGIKNISELSFVCLYVYYSPGGKEVTLTRLTE